MTLCSQTTLYTISFDVPSFGGEVVWRGSSLAGDYTTRERMRDNPRNKV